MWKVQEDEVDGLLTVAVTDKLSDADATRTKLALKQRMARQRAIKGKALILLDLTDYAGTTDDAVRQFEHVDGDLIQHPSDRVALVMRRSLDKVTARPLLSSPDQASLFLSDNAARTWLKAH